LSRIHLTLDFCLTRTQCPERGQRRDSQAAELVKLRYFAGLTMAQAAEALGISLRTAERNWTYARTWLRAELAEAEDCG
jgi:DNA-directed RNA polymerase specialized sigma24 family protein